MMVEITLEVRGSRTGFLHPPQFLCHPKPNRVSPMQTRFFSFQNRTMQLPSELWIGRGRGRFVALPRPLVAQKDRHQLSCISP